MPAHTLVHRALLLIVLTAGVGCAGEVFAAEGQTGDKTAAEYPRELAMRPLPAYRIEPPDILQIEIITAKAGKSSGAQSSPASEQGSVSSGTGTISGSDSQTKIGANTITLNAVPSTDDTKVGSGQTIPGATTLFISGSGNNYSGASVVSDGRNLTKTGAGILKFERADNVTVKDADWSTNTNSGTLTVSGVKLFTGETKVGGGVLNLAPSNSTLDFNMSTGAGARSLAAGPANMPKSDVTVPMIVRAQPGSGQYLVGPDGTINLRQYGTVQVTGMTIVEAKAALEKHLSKYLDSPEVWVDIFGYNSKVFYIITDGAGMGDNVRRIPICGNETVLDAVATVGGRSHFSSKRIWLVRPSPTNSENGLVLPVDYDAIIRHGATATNYQIMPGDRIFIAEDRAIAFYSWLSKVTSPVERVLGLISLGSATIQQIERLLPE